MPLSERSLQIVEQTRSLFDWFRGCAQAHFSEFGHLGGIGFKCPLSILRLEFDDVSKMPSTEELLPSVKDIFPTPPHLSQICRAAKGCSHLARSSPLRHSCSWRTLRLSLRERQVRPAWQRQAVAPIRSARGDAWQAAVRHDPDHRRHDRCRHFK